MRSLVPLLAATLSICVLDNVALAHEPAVARSAQQWLDQAFEDLESLRYEEARYNLRLALQTGAGEPALLVEVYRLLGETSGALGDAATAENAFANLLSLVPDFALPPGTSPKIEHPFEQARQWMAGRKPLRLTKEIIGQKVIVTVDSDPTHLVAAVRVAYTTGDGLHGALLSDPTSSNRFTIALPPHPMLSLEASALDRYGNLLVRSIATEEHARALPLPPPLPPARESVWRSPWLYGGGAVVSAGLAVGFGLKARSQNNDLAKCDENMSLCFPAGYEKTNDAADKNQLFALIGLASTALFSAAAIWFATRPKATEQPEAHVSASPSGLTLHF